VVDETLAGRSDFLKAFTIANVVFGREASFDPQNDPVVRIEAGRIRKALERYYLVAGQTDDVIITVPKGGYVPHFEYTASTPSPLPQMELAKPQLAASHGTQPHQDASRPVRPTLLHLAMTLAALLALGLALAFVLFTQRVAQPRIASGPKVIVEPFAESDRVDTGADIARGLRDDIIGQLTRFDDLVVVADPLRSEGAADADFALQGNVQLDGNRLRASARLVRQSDGAVVWANNFDADLRTENKLIIQGHIARQIANAIAEPYGIDKVASPAREGDQSGYTCTLAYYSYRQNMTDQNHDLARDCLKNATARFPDNAASWAQLSIVYLDEIRFRYQLRTAPSPQSLELATAAVNRAVALAPASPRTLQALMMVSFFRGDIDKALEAGTAAHAANPDDVEVAGEYGFRLAMSGKWQSGCELLSIALNRGVGTKGYYEVGMALCRLMNGDTEGAEQWARRSDLASNPMHHLVLLSILGTAGKTGEARLERDWLNRHAPVLMTNIRQELSLRLQRQEDQARFIDGLRAAGVDIPPAAAE
jgi:TolB-like protein/Tfp pilus assembly protein PilF